MPEAFFDGEPPLIRLSAPTPAAPVVLGGDWTVETLTLDGTLRSHPSAREVERHAKKKAWDLRAVGLIDDVGAMLLWRTWGGKRPAELQLKPEHEALFSRLDRVPRPLPVGKRWSSNASLLAVLGDAALAFIDHLSDFVRLFGQLLLDLGYIARHPTRLPWREISANVYRTGALALPITALVSFLIGIVLSYLSARQLKLFGADIYIVDILGISILRELGPVLAAILVAGRSGSSMTAQLGVMRVTQELDALAVLGISRSLRLVLPKVIALALALPLLVLWSNAIALIGGMVAANAQLNIGYRYFLNGLPDAVPVANFWLGVGKGAVFGVLIGLISCHFGLRIQPNTQSLGAGTTNSVVTAITIVILVDAIFAILFSNVGIP